MARKQNSLPKIAACVRTDECCHLACALQFRGKPEGGGRWSRKSLSFRSNWMAGRRFVSVQGEDDRQCPCRCGDCLGMRMDDVDQLFIRLAMQLPKPD